MVTANLQSYSHGRKLITGRNHPEGVVDGINLDGETYFDAKNINVHYISLPKSLLARSSPSNGIFGKNWAYLFYAD